MKIEATKRLEKGKKILKKNLIKKLKLLNKFIPKKIKQKKHAKL